MAARERIGRRDAAALARRRERMDRVNRTLCALLQQRARLAVEIAAWKHARGWPIADPQRERSMLNTMLVGAEPGFDRPALARLLRAVLRESRALALRAASRDAVRGRGGRRPPASRPTRARRA